MLGAGDTGLASGLFFKPKENAGDFGLFDSRIFASGEDHYKCFTFKFVFVLISILNFLPTNLFKIPVVLVLQLQFEYMIIRLQTLLTN